METWLEEGSIYSAVTLVEVRLFAKETGKDSPRGALQLSVTRLPPGRKENEIQRVNMQEKTGLWLGHYQRGAEIPVLLSAPGAARCTLKNHQTKYISNTRDKRMNCFPLFSSLLLALTLRGPAQNSELCTAAPEAAQASFSNANKK